MPVVHMWTRERGILWAVELTAPPPRVEPRVKASIREVGLAQVDALAAVSGDDPEALRSRLAAGRRGFAVHVQTEAGSRQEIAAYGWVSLGSEYIGEQERTIRLAPGEAYIWDCATLPAFRGNLFYSALLSQMLVVLAQEKVRRVWIGAGSDNIPSLRGFANAGFLPVAAITYIRFLDLRASRFEIQAHAPPELVRAARQLWIADDEHVWGAFAWRWGR